jgi:hypothetical protein
MKLKLNWIYNMNMTDHSEASEISAALDL